jgi:hypothetical protein
MPPTYREQNNMDYGDRLSQHHSERSNNAMEEYSTKAATNPRSVLVWLEMELQKLKI